MLNFRAVLAKNNEGGVWGGTAPPAKRYATPENPETVVVMKNDIFSFLGGQQNADISDILRKNHFSVPRELEKTRPERYHALAIRRFELCPGSL